MGLAADAATPGSGEVAHSTGVPMMWHRSSWCSADSCVEVGGLSDGRVAVRDSKSPDPAPMLVFTAVEWQSFLSGVKAGEFG
jgi:hypothetical protein